MKQDTIVESLNKNINENIRKEFQYQFEKTVTPSFEKYLIKLFEQIMQTFEKGQKFYIDKLTLEQQKNNQVKETMNEVVKTFVNISTTLTESVITNQSSFNKIENNILEKQTYITRLIDQMNEILSKQQELQKKIESSEKNFVELNDFYKNEFEALIQSLETKITDNISPKLRGTPFASGNIDLRESGSILPNFGSINNNNANAGSNSNNTNNATENNTKAQTGGEEQKKEIPSPGINPPHPHSQGSGYPGPPMYGQQQPLMSGSSQYYGSSRNQKPHSLQENILYLQQLMSGKPLDQSYNRYGGHGMMSPGASQMMHYNNYDMYHYHRNKQYPIGPTNTTPAPMYGMPPHPQNNPQQQQQIEILRQQIEQLQKGENKSDQEQQQQGGKLQYQGSNNAQNLDINTVQRESSQASTTNELNGVINHNQTQNSNNTANNRRPTGGVEVNATSLTNIMPEENNVNSNANKTDSNTTNAATTTTTTAPNNGTNNNNNNNNSNNNNNNMLNVPQLNSQPSFGTMNQNYGMINQQQQQFQPYGGGQNNTPNTTNSNNPNNMYPQQQPFLNIPPNQQYYYQQTLQQHPPMNPNFFQNPPLATNSPNNLQQMGGGIPQQMMHAQVNKGNNQNKPREGADFYQIPLVNSMVKESNNSGAQNTTTSTTNVNTTATNNTNSTTNNNPSTSDAQTEKGGSNEPTINIMQMPTTLSNPSPASTQAQETLSNE